MTGNYSDLLFLTKKVMFWRWSEVIRNKPCKGDSELPIYLFLVELNEISSFTQALFFSNKFVHLFRMQVFVVFIPPQTKFGGYIGVIIRLVGWLTRSVCGTYSVNSFQDIDLKL